MDHWQTPVYSVQTYLHPLRRVAKPLRYYLIRICHGLFSHYTIPTVAGNYVGRSGRIRTCGFCVPNAAHYQTVLLTVTYIHLCDRLVLKPAVSYWILLVFCSNLCEVVLQ